MVCVAPNGVERGLKMRVGVLSVSAAALLLLTGAGPQPVAPPKSAAANCQNTGSFERWLDAFKREAAAQGIRAGTIQAALGGSPRQPMPGGRLN